MSFITKIFQRRSIKKKYDPKNPVGLVIELDTFDKGGLQKVVLDMAKRLSPAHFKVVIVSINGGGYWAEEAQKHCLKVYLLEGPQDLNRYHQILQDEEIDLSCSHFSRIGYPLFQALGIPNITFIHNVYSFLPDPALRLFRRDDSMIDLYISVSKKATQYAVDNLGISSDKIITVPNGLIIDEHDKRIEQAVKVDRRDFSIHPDDYVFLNVASYNLHKGHYLMAEVMSRIQEKRKDIKLLCIGNVIVPHHVEELKNYIKEKNLEETMLLPGYFSNVESFFQMADAFLLPSFIEGWSIAMNEAMFHAMPMILTDTGGAAEVIENNDIGMLIPNEYGAVSNLHSQLLDELAYNRRTYSISDKLVAAMCNFADNREHWKKAGIRGRNKLLERYDFQDIVHAYERVFLTALR